ncbi:aminopeptidase P family protein [Mycoplasmopsis meleagridis]|uniref:aminopeptidase P family protein n=1 Tax=Mycoplasmopsis meleagridis TaxID=29561 RepID=UPI00073D5D7F|nr:aminopeptidase P family protein [Mycoplasmopsis meleagridis]KUH47578.1 Xaa-Pro aminopeptidase [Mycoplasmopsis meleagridis]
MNKEILNKLFIEKEIDAVISNAYQTRLWYSKIQTSDGYLVIEKEKAYLFVDGRYIEYAKNNAKNVEVILLNGQQTLSDFFDNKRYKKVAFEMDYIVFKDYKFLESVIKPEKIEHINGQLLRIKKSDEEIELLKKSIEISLKSYNELMDWIKPGMTEKQVAAKLNYLMKQNGAEKESFDEIIAAGKNSAEPHHHPTDDVLVEGEFLKIDFGALYKGYSADITRTIILGGDSKANNSELLKIKQIVLDAAKAGRDAIKPGVSTSYIDKVCREYIESKGYGKYFVHSTGHGLGIDVHELPNVNKTKETILEPGMVITVEPGIYIEGLGGYRNEDDVLVTETGRWVLSQKKEKN